MSNEELITQHLGNVTDSLKADAMSMLDTKDAEHKEEVETWKDVYLKIRASEHADKSRVKQLEEALNRIINDEMTSPWVSQIAQEALKGVSNGV